MVKSLTRKIICIWLIIMMAICFTACSSVRAMLITNEDGSIDELVYVTLDAEILTEGGYSMSSVKNDIMATAYAEARQIVQDYRDRVEADYLLADSATKTILAGYLQSVNIVGNKWEDNTYVIGLRFAEADVYKYFYGITSSGTASTATEEHFLYNKIYYYGKTLYADYSIMCDTISALYETNYPEFTMSDNELLYTYVSDSGREHSNADYVTKLDGKYYHTWIVDRDNVGQEIFFYNNIANRGNCVLVCIIATLIACGIMLLIGVIIIKIKNKKVKKTGPVS